MLKKSICWRRRFVCICIFTVLFLGVVVDLSAAVKNMPGPSLAPGPKDTCPVCGMFVSRYPAWVAVVRYQDGGCAYFDGAKDLFKYLQDLKKWAPDRRAEEITDIAVTEYYGLALIDARKAYYVIGSDVLGPMGHELIPLATQKDAAEFLTDHRGTQVLDFSDVTVTLLHDLDK